MVDLQSVEEHLTDPVSCLGRCRACGLAFVEGRYHVDLQGIESTSQTRCRAFAQSFVKLADGLHASVEVTIMVFTSPPSWDGLHAPVEADNLKDGLHKPTFMGWRTCAIGGWLFRGWSSQALLPEGGLQAVGEGRSVLPQPQSPPKVGGRWWWYGGLAVAGMAHVDLQSVGEHLTDPGLAVAGGGPCRPAECRRAPH